MASDLIIEKNTTLTVTDDPPREIEQYIQRIDIESLGELATAGLVEESSLDTMLAAARAVTTEALRRAAVTRPTPFVQGTKRLDLGRFTAFQINTASVTPVEQKIFWEVFRDLDPHRDIDLDVKVKVPSFINFLLADCTIEAGATLEFKGKKKRLTCGNLLIRRTGRIVAQSGLHIRAASIEGEQ